MSVKVITEEGYSNSQSSLEGTSSEEELKDEVEEPE